MSAIRRIVSGGQSGVDRAALDAAIEHAIDHGGWCPRGRIAEDGTIKDHYKLKETPSADYDQRTEWNVRDSDGVLLLTRGTIAGGTMYTKKMAIKLGRPYMVVNPCRWNEVDNVIFWLSHKAIETLDIAGPRESQQPGIYIESRRFLSLLFQRLIHDSS